MSLKLTVAMMGVAMMMVGFLTGCRSFIQAPLCSVGYAAHERTERKNHNKCYPIKSYEGWNRCMGSGNCSNQSQPKTKRYAPDDSPWIRPRSYAYP